MSTQIHESGERAGEQAHRCGLIAWADFFCEELAWLGGFALLATGDQALATAALVAAYAELEEAYALVLNPEAARRVARRAVALHSRRVQQRWQHQPHRCSEFLAALEDPLQLTFYIWFVVGPPQALALEPLRRKDPVLQEIVTRATAFFAHGVAPEPPEPNPVRAHTAHAAIAR
jgi:hypothetical protein